MYKDILWLNFILFACVFVYVNKTDMSESEKQRALPTECALLQHFMENYFTQ